MTGEDRAFVEKLCVDLEAKFPGVTAAHEGFKSSYLGGERDGFLVVEVFDVPDGRIEEVLRAGEALAFGHLMKGGGFVTFSLWSPEETRQHFLEDVAAVRSERLNKSFSDLSGRLEALVASLCWQSAQGERSDIGFPAFAKGWWDVACSFDATGRRQLASHPRVASKGSVTCDRLGLAA